MFLRMPSKHPTFHLEKYRLNIKKIFFFLEIQGKRRDKSEQDPVRIDDMSSADSVRHSAECFTGIASLQRHWGPCEVVIRCQPPRPPHLRFPPEGTAAGGRSSPHSTLVSPLPGHLHLLLGSVLTL